MNRQSFFPRFLSGLVELQDIHLMNDTFISTDLVPYGPNALHSIGRQQKPFNTVYARNLFNEFGQIGVNDVNSEAPILTEWQNGLVTIKLNLDNDDFDIDDDTQKLTTKDTKISGIGAISCKSTKDSDFLDEWLEAFDFDDTFPKTTAIKLKTSSLFTQNNGTLDLVRKTGGTIPFYSTTGDVLDTQSNFTFDGASLLKVPYIETGNSLQLQDYNVINKRYLSQFYQSEAGSALDFVQESNNRRLVKLRYHNGFFKVNAQNDLEMKSIYRAPLFIEADQNSSEIHLKYDAKSIKLNSQNQLEFGLTGKAIRVDLNTSAIDVDFDNSLKLIGNQLSLNIEPAAPIKINDGRIISIDIDAQTMELTTDNKLACKTVLVDNQTVGFTTDNKLRGLYAFGNGLKIGSTPDQISAKFVSTEYPLKLDESTGLLKLYFDDSLIVDNAGNLSSKPEIVDNYTIIRRNDATHQDGALKGNYVGENGIMITGNKVRGNYTAGTRITINGSTISSNTGDLEDKISENAKKIADAASDLITQAATLGSAIAAASAIGATGVALANSALTASGINSGLISGLQAQQLLSDSALSALGLQNAANTASIAALTSGLSAVTTGLSTGLGVLQGEIGALGLSTAASIGTLTATCLTNTAAISTLVGTVGGLSIAQASTAAGLIATDSILSALGVSHGITAASLTSNIAATGVLSGIVTTQGVTLGLHTANLALLDTGITSLTASIASTLGIATTALSEASVGIGLAGSAATAAGSAISIGTSNSAAIALLYLAMFGRALSSLFNPDTGETEIIEAVEGLEDRVNAMLPKSEAITLYATSAGTGILKSTNGVISINPIQSFTSLNLTSTTSAISQTTGTLTVAGGVGVLGAIYAGNIFSGGLAVATQSFVSSVYQPISGMSNYTTLTSFNNLNTTVNNLSTNVTSNYVQKAEFLSTTESINPSTGCLVLSGGLGVEKSVSIGGTLRFTDPKITHEPILNKYPPASLSGSIVSTSNQSATLSGYSYGNGTYYVKQSSWQSVSWAMLDSWSSTSNQFATATRYDGTTLGVYTGSLSTLVSGTSYNGEWLQIQFPSKAKMRQLNWRPCRGYPRDFLLAGSNNEVDWTLLLLVVNETNWVTNGPVRSFYFENNIAFSYYRVICTRVYDYGFLDGHGIWFNGVSESQIKFTDTEDTAVTFGGGIIVAKNVSASGFFVGSDPLVVQSYFTNSLSTKQDLISVSYPLIKSDSTLSIDLSTYEPLLTAGTGLIKTSGTLSLNTTQTGITSVGTLTGLTVSGVTAITNTTVSSATINGALTVAGGLGVAGAIYAGSLFSGGAAVATQSFVTSGYEPLLTAGTGLTKTGSTLTVNTAQTGITSVGTLTYLNVSGYINFGDSSTSTHVMKTSSSGNNVLKLQNESVSGYSTLQISDSANTPRLYVGYGNPSVVNITVRNNNYISTVSPLVILGNVVKFTETTASSSAGAGAVQISGGAYVAGSIYAGGLFVGSAAVATQSFVTAGYEPILTAGTGLTKTTGILSVNTAQTGVTSLGTLTGLTVSGVTAVTNTTVLSATTNGALTVAGGLGVVGAIYAGSLFSGGAAVATQSFVTSGYEPLLTAGTGLTKTGSTLTVNVAQTGITSVGTLTGLTVSGVTVVTNTTVSTSTITGAFRVSGGVGVTGSLYAGNLFSNGLAVATQSFVSAGYEPILTAGTGLTKTGSTLSLNQTDITSVGTLTGLTVSGVTAFTNTTVSSATTNGALTIAGGLGVAGAIYAGSMFSGASAVVTTAGTGLTKTGSTLALNAAQTGITSNGILTGLTVSGVTSVTNTTVSSSTTTGALRVSGGVGVAGSLYANNIYSGGNLVATQSYIASLKYVYCNSSSLFLYPAAEFGYNSTVLDSAITDFQMTLKGRELNSNTFFGISSRGMWQNANGSFEGPCFALAGLTRNNLYLSFASDYNKTNGFYASTSTPALIHKLDDYLNFSYRSTNFWVEGTGSNQPFTPKTALSINLTNGACMVNDTELSIGNIALGRFGTGDRWSVLAFHSTVSTDRSGYIGRAPGISGHIEYSNTNNTYNLPADPNNWGQMTGAHRFMQTTSFHSAILIPGSISYNFGTILGYYYPNQGAEVRYIIPNSYINVSLVANASISCKGSFFAVSDETTKKNIITLDPKWSLETVDKIQPIHYHRNEDNVACYGFSAQNVRQSAGEAVKSLGKLCVDHNQLVAILWSAVKDMSKRMTLMENELNELKKKTCDR